MLRIYRFLLRLYPASFRAEYGEELRRDVARRARDVSGPAAVVAFWIAALADIVNNASRVQWDVLRQDLHYSRRLFQRAPAFALTAIAVSGLGIGATTATFSMADHVLLRPLPFHAPDRLVRVWEDQSFRGYPQLEVSPANFRDWQQMNHSFSSLAAYADAAVNMLGQGSPERVASATVTASLFGTLGVSPALGRSFSGDDDRAGAPGTVILSHRLWQSHFGADPRIVGRTIVLNDERCAVIGVMRPDFDFPSRETQLWVPFRWVADDFSERDNFWLYPIARLRDGTTLEDARAEMKVIAAQLEHAYPKANERTSAGVYLLRDNASDRLRLLLMALAGGSLCILLIACMNLASLLVARALSRQREFAVRCAIGAGRERLVRQMLTESVVLAGIGGMAGLALALSASPFIARLVPPTLPIAETPPLDVRVLGIGLAATILTGVGFGLVPALRMSRARTDALREGARTGTSRPTERLRSLLVVAQVTATVILLMTSGLLLRALWRVQNTDPGFRVEGVQTFRTALPFPRYEQTMRRAAFYRRVLGEVRHLAGVSQAAYISFLPMTMRGGIWAVVPEGATAHETEGPTASLRFVTPGFFDTMRIPLRLGRDISDRDDAEAPKAAVVSESFVRRHWPGLDPIGRRFFFAFEMRTVIGVVGDVRVRGLERTSEPQVYLSYLQVPDGWLAFFTPKDLVVRSQLAPDALVPTVRRIIAAADPEQPISDVQPLADIVTADTASRRVQARVLMGFALMAFLLAGIGVHGLLAFTVSARARELSVRIALGARPTDIVISVVKRAAVLSAAGVGAGVLVGLSAGRTLQALLAGIEPADPQTIAAVVVACGVVTLLGSAMPAVRAGRTNPIEAMKAE